MNKTFLDMIEEVLFVAKEPLHVDVIALQLVEAFPNIQDDLDVLPNKISTALSKDVRKKESRFSKPKNKSGGFKKGIYQLKRNRRLKKVIEFSEQPSVSTQFTGRAGEHAVLSELLFWGFNSSIMAVDDGIDVVASKENTYFHIQVKTSNVSNGAYSFKISKDRFDAKHSSQTFYICVLRRRDSGRYINDFAIFPSSELRRLVDSKFFKSTKDISMQIKISDKGEYILNNERDITLCVNKWDAIV